MDTTTATTTPANDIRELDHRYSDGIDVTLLWNSRTGAIGIAVQDSRSGHAFELPVDPAEALEAFRHPYAYAFGPRRRACVPIS